MDYLVKALTVWFIGFFPYFEIYLAVPAGFALGLDPMSIIFWSAFGNCVPIFLINYLYSQAIKNERVNGWLSKLTSEKLKSRVDKYGIWFILLGTPWTGIWTMMITMKMFQMDERKLISYSTISIVVYAIVITVLIVMGIEMT